MNDSLNDRFWVSFYEMDGERNAHYETAIRRAVDAGTAVMEMVETWQQDDMWAARFVHAPEGITAMAETQEGAVVRLLFAALKLSNDITIFGQVVRFLSSGEPFFMGGKR